MDKTVDMIYHDKAVSNVWSTRGPVSRPAIVLVAVFVFYKLMSLCGDKDWRNL